MAQQLQYGAPFRGYVCSVPRHRAPMNAMTSDSQDCVMDPLSGAIERRGGMAIQGDTHTSHEVNGLLEAAWQARSRRLFPMRSDSLTDGYETYAALYTRETHPNGGTYPTQDDGIFGTVLVRNTNAGATLANYSLYQEFSATHYPTKGGTYNTVHHMVGVPLRFDSGDGGYTRGAFAFARRFLAAGSRNVLDANGKLYLPGTAANWNKRFNDATGTGSEVNRLMPSGPTPPAAVPIVGSPSAVGTGNDAAWKDGDRFFVGVIYRRKDGSYTMPALPRTPNGNLPSGLGVVVVGTPGAGVFYKSITWAVPIGPDDTDTRILVRSTKENIAAATATIGVDPYALKICGVIRNNTQTQFVDSNGNDLGLLTDTNIVRLDHVPPRLARFIGTGDQRALLGYTTQNPQAMVVAPMSLGAANWGIGQQGLNDVDTSSVIYGNQVGLVRITETEFQLCRYDVAGPTLYTHAIALAGNSIQDVCDLINVTAVADVDGQRQWRAQMCPGVDGTLAATGLLPTTWARTCTGVSGASSITCDTPGDFAKIPLSYKVTGSASIPANTCVIRKDGDRLYLGDESGASVVLTGAIASVSLTFAADCGDGTAYHATNRGYIRAFAASYYFMPYLKRSALATTVPDKQSTYFTVSSPGAAVSGVSLAPESFVAGNRRGADSRLGIHQGFADLEGAAVVGFSKGLRFFVNVRGVNSGEDFDYRLMTVEDAGGVTDDKAFVGGRGWAAYGNDEGVFAIDKNRAPKRIAGDLHNFDSPDGQSVLAFELALCRDAVDADKDTNALHLSVTGSILHLTYRTSAVAYSQVRQTYHFAPGIEAAGLEELIDPDSRQTYGWGAPCNQPVSHVCDISTAAGRKRLATIDTNAGVTNGRIDAIDTTDTQDNGLPYDSVAYLATAIPGWFLRFSALRFEAIHTSPLGATPRVRWHRLMDRSSYSESVMEHIGEDPAREIFELAMEARSNGNAAEPAWFFSDVDGEKLFGLCGEVDTADAY